MTAQSLKLTQSLVSKSKIEKFFQIAKLNLAINTQTVKDFHDTFMLTISEIDSVRHRNRNCTFVGGVCRPECIISYKKFLEIVDYNNKIRDDLTPGELRDLHKKTEMKFIKFLKFAKRTEYMNLKHAWVDYFGYKRFPAIYLPKFWYIFKYTKNAPSSDNSDVVVVTDGVPSSDEPSSIKDTIDKLKRDEIEFDELDVDNLYPNQTKQNVVGSTDSSGKGTYGSTDTYGKGTYGSTDTYGKGTYGSTDTYGKGTYGKGTFDENYFNYFLRQFN
jgi:hypothetical protein